MVGHRHETSLVVLYFASSSEVDASKGEHTNGRVRFERFRANTWCAGHSRPLFGKGMECVQGLENCSRLVTLGDDGNKGPTVGHLKPTFGRWACSWPCRLEHSVRLYNSSLRISQTSESIAELLQELLTRHG